MARVSGWVRRASTGLRWRRSATRSAQLLDAAQSEFRLVDVKQDSGNRGIVAELAQTHHQRQEVPIRLQGPFTLTRAT